MDIQEAIVSVTAGIVVAAVILWLLYELLVRAFASYASSEEPRSAELFAQLAFFFYRHGFGGSGNGALGSA